RGPLTAILVARKAIKPEPYLAWEKTGRVKFAIRRRGGLRPTRPLRLGSKNKTERSRHGRERGRTSFGYGRYWARTSDPQLVELGLSQLSEPPGPGANPSRLLRASPSGRPSRPGPSFCTSARGTDRRSGARRSGGCPPDRRSVPLADVQKDGPGRD